MVESGESTSLPPQGWETCKQDERKMEVMRNESFHVVASQDEAATQAPVLSS